MKNPLRAVLLAGMFLLWAGTAGAQNSSSAKHGPVLSKQNVMSIAKAQARAEWIDLAKYNMLSCNYESTNSKRMWTVLFEQKPPKRPGGNFVVWVDDRNGKAFVVKGG